MGFIGTWTLAHARSKNQFVSEKKKKKKKKKNSNNNIPDVVLMARDKYAETAKPFLQCKFPGNCRVFPRVERQKP
jgi:hypothetical protein